MGRRPQRPFRGLLSVHYSLRPACFADLLSRPFPAVLQPICCLLSRSRCFWSERQLTSRDFHPVMSVPSQGAHNPYSEAQFKTLKYSPGYPDRFPGYDDAHDFCVRFVAWYNHEHRHSGIAFMTPADVHYGRIDAVLADHAAALTAAYAAHPERFVHGPPTPRRPPAVVYINPPTQPSAPDHREHDGLPHALPAADPFHPIEEKDPEIHRH